MTLNIQIVYYFLYITKKETITRIKEIKEKMTLPKGSTVLPIEMTLSSAQSPFKSHNIMYCKNYGKTKSINVRKGKALTTLFWVAYASQSNSTIAIRLLTLITEIWYMIRNVIGNPCPQLIFFIVVSVTCQRSM